MVPPLLVKVPLLVQFPLTVNVYAPPSFSVPAAMVMLPHAAAASIVTVTLMLIDTSSLEVGTAAPPQVAVELQFPVTDAVLVAPFIFCIPTISISRQIINLFESLTAEELLKNAESLLIKNCMYRS